MANVVIDPQINGVQDDGTDYGHVRSRLVSGELVRLPLWPGDYYLDLAGSTTAPFSGGIATDPDGTGNILALSIPADNARAGAGARIFFPFRGTCWGFRTRRNNGVAAARYDILVDGVACPVIFVNTVLRLEGSQTSIVQEQAAMVYDLADGEHVAELTFPADAWQTRTLYLFGWLAERRAGYTERPRVDGLLGPSGTSTQTVPNGTIGTTNPTAIQSQSAVTSISLGSFLQIIYHNTGAAAADVGIYGAPSSSALGNEIDRFTLAARGSSGDTYYWPPNNARLKQFVNANGGTNLAHIASAAGVNYTIAGGMR